MNAAELEKGLLSLGFTSEDSLKAIRLLGVGATLSIGNALNALFEDKSSSNVSKRICPHCNNEYGSVSDLSLHAKKRHLASSLSRSMSGSAPRAAESPKPNKLPKDNTYSGVPESLLTGDRDLQRMAAMSEGRAAGYMEVPQEALTSNDKATKSHYLTVDIEPDYGPPPAVLLASSHQRHGAQLHASYSSTSTAAATVQQRQQQQQQQQLQHEYDETPIDLLRRQQLTSNASLTTPGVSQMKFSSTQISVAASSAPARSGMLSSSSHSSAMSAANSAPTTMSAGGAHKSSNSARGSSQQSSAPPHRAANNHIHATTNSPQHSPATTRHSSATATVSESTGSHYDVVPLTLLNRVASNPKPAPAASAAAAAAATALPASGGGVQQAPTAVSQRSAVVVTTVPVTQPPSNYAQIPPAISPYSNITKKDKAPRYDGAPLLVSQETNYQSLAPDISTTTETNGVGATATASSSAPPPPLQRAHTELRLTRGVTRLLATACNQPNQLPPLLDLALGLKQHSSLGNLHPTTARSTATTPTPRTPHVDGGTDSGDEGDDDDDDSALESLIDVVLSDAIEASHQSTAIHASSSEDSPAMARAQLSNQLTVSSSLDTTSTRVGRTTNNNVNTNNAMIADVAKSPLTVTGILPISSSSSSSSSSFVISQSHQSNAESSGVVGGGPGVALLASHLEQIRLLRVCAVVSLSLSVARLVQSTDGACSVDDAQARLRSAVASMPIGDLCAIRSSRRLARLLIMFTSDEPSALSSLISRLDRASTHDAEFAACVATTLSSQLPYSQLEEVVANTHVDEMAWLLSIIGRDLEQRIRLTRAFEKYDSMISRRQKK